MGQGQHVHEHLEMIGMPRRAGLTVLNVSLLASNCHDIRPSRDLDPGLASQREGVLFFGVDGESLGFESGPAGTKQFRMVCSPPGQIAAARNLGPLAWRAM